jgi:type IV pilus assembly protein PilW
MRLTNRLPRSYQTGFSLVELMVGMAIGLLATIIVIQVMSVFDAQRRTTTGSADAQTNGGIALFSIARELKMGGYPLLPLTDSALECTTTSFNGVAPGAITLTPVSITNGVAAAGVNASDRITIRYGNSQMGGVATQSTGSVTGTTVTVGNSLGCKRDDITVISSAAACNLSTVATDWDLSPTSIKMVNAAGGNIAGANVACLGAWTEVTYAVNQATGNLERTVTVNGAGTSTTPSVVGIVNLQAQYGISATANSNQVTEWVDASGATWAAPTVANRNRIKAVRIAVVARNERREGQDVTTACSSLTDPAPTGLCAWPGTVTFDGTTWAAPSVDLSPGDASWAQYRYRVYETIIPLRNVIWSKDVL